MQGLIDLIAGIVVLMAAAALSQFGVDLQFPQPTDREVHRTADCPQPPAGATAVQRPSRSC